MENKYGYIKPLIQPGEYIHGDKMLGDIATNPSGQWDAWLPADEFQNRGYETYSCVSEAVLHCTEILGRNQSGDLTQYSVRFLATQSGTGQKQGNDDNTVAETLRKGGCVQESDWPFTASNYQAFYTPPPANIVTLAGYQFRDNSFGHSWVTDTSPQGIMEALTFSPLALGVYAWAAPDTQGIYHRPPGAIDCHEVTIYGYAPDYSYWKIFDSYDSTHKRLAWDYGFGIGKRFTLNRVIPTSPTPDGVGWVNWKVWIQTIRNWLRLGSSSPVVPSMLDTFCGAIRDFEGKPGDLNYINNNPGNCRCSSVGYLPKYGKVLCVPTASGNFAKFPTYALGWQYLQNLVLYRAELHPTWTILDFFTQYAPSGDNNPTLKYAAFVANRCGKPIDTTLESLFK